MANYTIQRGDTLSGIAKKNNTDVNTLMGLNPYITNANKIYAGKNLVLPDAQPVQQQVTTATPAPQVQEAVQPTTPAPVQQAQPTQTTQELATAYAQNATANAQNDTQALLAQYEKIAENQKNALAQQKELASQNIASQKEDVMSAYHDNARQAYINSMLGKKDVQQQLSQAGLNTSGLVGSAYADVQNAYGNNLANLQTSRDKAVQDINKQLNQSNMEFAIQESQMMTDIENTKLDLQKYGNELAYQKYQDALNNYMNFANYEYQKQRDIIADNRYLNEWQRQLKLDELDEYWRNKQFEYQVGRDQVADNQWQQQYNLSKYKASQSASDNTRYKMPEDENKGKPAGNDNIVVEGNTWKINKDGKTYTLTVTPGAKPETILAWGQRIGVDLSDYLEGV